MPSSSHFTVALFVAFLGALLAAASASAQQVGTATAVNPLSESTPPGGATALRVVGGQLSHQGEASITTSAANIGIRGGTVTVIQGQNGVKVINVSGIIKIVNGTGTFLLTRSDFGVLIQGWNTPIQ